MLGDIVREARTRKGLTQARLARLADVSRRHLAALEKGANVSMLVLEKVASVLELTDIQLDSFSIHRTGAQAFNLPLLADSLREARASARRAETMIARAEGIISGDAGKAIPAEAPPKGLSARFPPLPARRLDVDLSSAGGDAVHDRPEWLEVRTGGELRQGQPVDESKKESVVVPSSLLDAGEILFRVRGEELRDLGIEDGDILIVQLRPAGRAATGELAIAKIGNAVYVGRWWQKHGEKALMTDGLSELTIGPSKRSLKVMAVVNQIVRTK
jgi:transcriptional regulator with XRE-family HTH domain